MPPSRPILARSLKPLLRRSVTSSAVGQARLATARRAILPTPTTGATNHARHHVPVKSQS